MTPEQQHALDETRWLKKMIVGLLNERDIEPMVATTALIELLAGVLTAKTKSREAAHQGAQVAFRTITEFIDMHHGELHG